MILFFFASSIRSYVVCCWASVSMTSIDSCWARWSHRKLANQNGVSGSVIVFFFFFFSFIFFMWYSACPLVAAFASTVSAAASMVMNRDIIYGSFCSGRFCVDRCRYCSSCHLKSKRYIYTYIHIILLLHNYYFLLHNYSQYSFASAVVASEPLYD